MRYKVKKEILALLADLKGILPQAEQQPKIFEEAAALVAEIKKFCQSEPCNQQNFYSEILEGLQMALLSGMQEPAEAWSEIISLSLELLQTVKAEFSKEPAKKEIVFLPYKADMWDSLESIWQAAFDDKDNCNVYVVPLPYADRTHEGKIRSWHLDNDKYPEYVPVTDYRAIDLKKLQPDVIFIHNGYDGNNTITSVPDIFYSPELKKCTDKLVYVPYFVTGERVVEKSLLSPANIPAIAYADVVIVESEYIREQYVKVYHEYFPNADTSKFLALGSPKYDKAVGAKREDYSLPEEWKVKLEGKKSILYNTTISAFGNNFQIYFKKMREVFAEFRQNENVVVWWRPHPLLESTIAAAFPDILGEYLAMVEEFKQSGLGIYDDTADLYRAIAWTDAYYGDYSSLIPLYQKTGKPIMVQNIKLLKEEKTE